VNKGIKSEPYYIGYVAVNVYQLAAKVVRNLSIIPASYGVWDVLIMEVDDAVSAIDGRDVRWFGVVQPDRGAEAKSPPLAWRYRLKTAMVGKACRMRRCADLKASSTMSSGTEARTSAPTAPQVIAARRAAWVDSPPAPSPSV
jgi:hypothetical protein